MANHPINIDGEIWRDLPGHNGEVQVSNKGRMRRILIYASFEVPAYPYIRVSYSYRAKRKLVNLHRMVCLAFHGEPNDDRIFAAHLNGNSKDNRPENLAWVTPKENAAHKIIHGTHQSGEQNANAIITAEDVRRIRAVPLSREEKDALAEKLGITRGHINDIIKRKCWRDVP